MKIGCAYFGNRIIRHVESDMKMLRDLGFNFVVHTFSEFDLQFHKGTMQEIVSVTREAGHEVWLDPWGVGNVFGGEPYSNFAAVNIFEGCQVLDDEKPVSMACPNNPLFLDYMREWVEAVKECEADGIFWDEPHFHDPNFLGGRKGRWGCRCRFCREKFEQIYNEEMPETETDSVRDFKIISIKEFIEMLIGLSRKAGLKNTLCLAPHIGAKDIKKLWRPYASLKELDILGTDPYWQMKGEPVEMVRDYAVAIRELCREFELETQLWIQLFKLRRGSGEEVKRAINVSLEEGIVNLAVWGFEGCDHEAWSRCESPEEEWKAAVDALEEAGKNFD